MSETLVKPPIALETRISMYELQYRLRVFEKRAYDLFLQNLVKGTSHLALGQEAIAAGVCTVVRHTSEPAKCVSRAATCRSLWP